MLNGDIKCPNCGNTQIKANWGYNIYEAKFPCERKIKNGRLYYLTDDRKLELSFGGRDNWEDNAHFCCSNCNFYSTYKDFYYGFINSCKKYFFYSEYAEIRQLKDKSKNLKKTIESLNDKIEELKKINESKQKEIESKEKEIKSKEIDIESKQIDIESKEKEIESKEIEIKKLYHELISYKTNNGLETKNNNNTKIDLNNYITVKFSIQNNSHETYSITCLKTEIFAEVEEKLYKELELKFPELRDTNNYFLSNGNQILRFRTIEENKITTSPVLLFFENIE